MSTPQIPEKAPRWLIITFVSVVAVAGCGFLFKLTEFAQTLNAAPEVSFALMPVITYLAVAAGFFCLLAWATLGGQWKDIEAAKRWMLENDAALDAATAPPDGDGTSAKP